MSRFEGIIVEGNIGELNFIIKDNNYVNKTINLNTNKGRIELIDLLNSLDSEIGSLEYEAELKESYIQEMEEY